MSSQKTGLVLWGGIELDLTLSGLRSKTCELCGAPATVAVRRLDEQQRRFLCASHRSAR